MTINEYLESLPDMTLNTGKTLRESVMETTDVWNNSACKGYIILAMKEAGYPNGEIENVLSKLRWIFDEVPIAQAEQAYKDF